MVLYIPNNAEQSSAPAAGMIKITRLATTIPENNSV